MARRLDLDTWSRRAHFEYYKHHEQPFFNICTEVDVTGLVEATTGGLHSFFLAALYLSLRAVNGVEELRLRIRGDEVVEHDEVHGGSTVLRPDRTFGFGYFAYESDYSSFEAAGREELERVRASRTLEDQGERDDLVYFSVLPWISFTSFAHARRCPATESNPRVVFGKRSSALGGAWRMPLSIEVHHALVDGLHVSEFLDTFQTMLSAPAALLGD